MSTEGVCGKKKQKQKQFAILIFFSYCSIFDHWDQSLCVCVMKKNERRRVCVHRKHCFIDCTWLDWIGRDQMGQGVHQMRVGAEGMGSELDGRERGQTDRGRGGNHSGMQPSLRQHKQHADTVTGNIVIIILLFKVSLKTLKLYKKEENRFFALMKNTFFDFFPSYKEDSNTRK